ncbi:MAG: class A beta-lactamase [Janthinobacterium lividum]
MPTRRSFLAAATLALPCLIHAEVGALAALPQAFADLEKRNGGRLGVAVLDTGSGARTGYRADELFPMCSTFKFLLVAAVLRRVDTNNESLLRQVDVPAKPLLGNSPLTEPHAGGSMTVGALCHAALTRSDNTAANILLEAVGGPASVTQFARTLHDPVTRLDRNEPTLNSSLVGDPRDTTSPTAMTGDLQNVLLGDGLADASRMQITQWMEANLTGLERLRANLPAGWRAADRTGANGEHTSNDIAVLWPVGRPPVVVAAYLTQCPGPEAKRGAVLAEIGRLVSGAI